MNRIIVIILLAVCLIWGVSQDIIYNPKFWESWDYLTNFIGG